MINLKLDLRKIILLMITNISSMAFNPISIWMFPLLYFFFTVIMLLKKQIKNVFKMVLVILPNLILLPIYIIFGLTNGNGTIEALEYVGYLTTFKDFIRNRTSIFYIICIKLYIYYF